MKAVINEADATVKFNDGKVTIQELRNAYQALLDVKVECAVFSPDGLAFCLTKTKSSPRRVSMPLFGMPVNQEGQPLYDELFEILMMDIVCSHLPNGWGLVHLTGGPAVRKNLKGQIEAFRNGDWRPI